MSECSIFRLWICPSLSSTCRWHMLFSSFLPPLCLVLLLWWSMGLFQYRGQIEVVLPTYHPVSVCPDGRCWRTKIRVFTVLQDRTQGQPLGSALCSSLVRAYDCTHYGKVLVWFCTVLSEGQTFTLSLFPYFEVTGSSSRIYGSWSAAALSEITINVVTPLD